MRTLAIGDIHGCSVAFESILERVRPVSGDTLILLGDLVDRGPDSAGVLERVIRLGRVPGLNLICVRGNHDQMMVEARQSKTSFEEWMHVGGEATLKSYACFGDPGCLDDVPTEHWELIGKKVVDFFETPTHFFVHANVDANLPLAEQPDHLLRWEKFRDPAPHVSGKVMVCGHTAQKSGYPQNIGHAICIDTAVYKPHGWLTCLDVGNGAIVQCNQGGECRTGRADEFLVSCAGVDAAIDC